MPESDNSAIIFTGNTVQADLVRSVLEASGIRVFLKDEVIGTLAPWRVVGGGRGAVVKVLVPSSEVERAKAALKPMEPQSSDDSRRNR